MTVNNNSPTNNPTLQLLRTIGFPNNGCLEPKTAIESPQLYQVARQNKIGALYVKALHDQDKLTELRNEFEERKDFHERLGSTCSRFKQVIPQGIPYVVAKTHHPFWADFSDVDVLVFDNQNGRVINRIKQTVESEDYEVLGVAPSAMTIRDRETDQLIDIQDDFGLHEVLYFDKETIRNKTVMGDISGTTMPIVSKPNDLVIHVNHSITELMFTLKEYYAAVFALENFDTADVDELLETAQKNNCKKGTGAFFTLIKELTELAFSTRPDHINRILRECGHSSGELDKLHRENFQVPHRYSNRTLLAYTIDRFRNPVFSKSVLREIPAALHPSTAYYLSAKMYDRFTRDDYVRA